MKAMIHRRGALFAFDSKAGFQTASHHFKRQEKAGITVEYIDAAAIRQMEPSLSDAIVGAAYFPDSCHVSDPRLITEALFEAALARNIGFTRAAVTSIEAHNGVIIHCDGKNDIKADRAVIALGAWSKKLAADVGDKVPLDTERGYNVSFKGVTDRLRRPVSFQGHGFVTTPLDTGLRIGGAVELGGLDLPPNHARTRALYTKAQRLIRDLPAFGTGEIWMGFRPSIPDSLPVIGRSRNSPHIIHAFGHGHYGLTQSAATARLVADLIAERSLPIDLSAFSPQRF